MILHTQPMNFDRLCITFVLLMLPILWLPAWALPFAVLCSLLLFTLSVLSARFSLILLMTMLLFSYVQVLETNLQADKIRSEKRPLTFRVIKILKQQQYQTAIAQSENRQILLSWQSETPLLLDHDYQATLTLRPISGRANLGNFSRQRWLFANHLEATANVRHATLLTSSPPRLRTQWLNETQTALAKFANNGLLLALAFGERAWLDHQSWQAFQQTSTAHLIAISGLHVALAAYFGFWIAKTIQWLLVWLSQYHPCLNKPLQAVGFSLYFPHCTSFILAFAYSFLAGFSLPTLRALGAITLYLACQLIRRHYASWQLWWRTVAILILFDPLALLSDSFWLSILAVASLIFWYQYFPLAHFLLFDRHSTYDKIKHFVLSLLHLQIGIWLVFMPVQLFFFEGISPVALVANLFLVPLYSLLLVPVILFSLLSHNVLNSWWLADQIAQFSLAIINPLAPFWQSLPQLHQWQLITLHLLILLVIYGKQREVTRRYWLFISIFLLLFNRLGSVFIRHQADYQWIHFDVGQGLAMALIYPQNEQQQAVIFDTGSSWQGGSMAELEILPYLKRHKIQLQAIFLSHDDNDHAGGVATLLHAFPKARLISASKRHYAQKKPEACEAGKRWFFGEISLTSLAPIEQVNRAKNEHSCVLNVEMKGYKLLLTGDTTQKQELRFTPQLTQIDFLQVAHHGSKTSTSQTLLTKIQPKLAVISSSRFNPWRMPHQQVIERLNANQIPWLNTAEVGMIRLDFSAQGWKITTARDQWSAWFLRYIQ